MVTSELIERLAHLMHKYGDLPVNVSVDDKDMTAGPVNAYDADGVPPNHPEAV